MARPGPTATAHACPALTSAAPFVNSHTTPPLPYAGASVTSGQPLFILEAMKMEHVVKAPFAGTVAKLSARPGDLVEDGRALATVQKKAA